jgi:hypothetical protein
MKECIAIYEKLVSTIVETNLTMNENTVTYSVQISHILTNLIDKQFILKSIYHLWSS